MEVNRIFNMKKTNLDRQNNITGGKIKTELYNTGPTKKIGLGKNIS